MRELAGDHYDPKMPPTRGHDLKLFPCDDDLVVLKMPPTRGHDLKQQLVFTLQLLHGCPPHGGTT